jgi:hypothetical protein
MVKDIRLPPTWRSPDAYRYADLMGTASSIDLVRTPSVGGRHRGPREVRVEARYRGRRVESRFEVRVGDRRVLTLTLPE